MLRLALALALLPALAAAQRIRTGEAAYGGWRDSAPGVLRRIEPRDMPPPHATRSASDAPEVIRRPAGAMPQLPPGFAASLWASGLELPRVIRRAPNGDMFVAESGAGRVLAYRAIPGAARAPKPGTFAAGLTQPFGIAFWPPAAPRYVYIAETERVLRYPYRPGDLRAGGKPQTVIAHLPSGGHWTRDLAAAPDGSRLYVSVGSAGNAGTGMGATPPGGLAPWQAKHGVGAAWGDETGRADLLWFAPEGGALHPFANGLRNCAGLAIQPATGAPWCVVNERDGLGDNLPPDYATPVQQGGFYGWPWFYIGDHREPRLSGRQDLAGKVTVPQVLLQPHSAPLGIAFYDVDQGPAAFPAEYRGDAFVALHGSWNRSQRTGYKLVRLPLHDPALRGSYQDFATGFVASDDQVWARPVDVAVAADGALLMTEDGNGTIWRIAPAR